MIYCFGEQGVFPENEFVHTKDGKIFQPYIHHAQPEHWATTGIPVDPGSIPNVISYDRVKGIIEIKTELSSRHEPSIPNIPLAPMAPEREGEV